MTYQETIDYLYTRLPMFQRIGPVAFKKDLTNIKALLNALDNPHESFKCIHVGGTNGKGSISHILAACLSRMGFKTGLYTSPHYKDIRERIKVDGNYVDKDFFIDFIDRNKSLIESVEPSYFELMVAMSFDYFKAVDVKYAVVEVGLGGRLDSTNVIDPVLSVISNIGFDHQKFLGDTLELIAGEKAGIIKPNRPVIIGERQKDIEHVFLEKAMSVNAPIYFASDQTTVHWKDIYQKENGIDITHNGELILEGIATDLLANYQLKNIATAFNAIELFCRLENIDCLPGVFAETIATVRTSVSFFGRFDKISHQPTIILDSAHNINGMEALLDEISYLSYDHLHIVFGTVSDKDVTPLFKLMPSSATYYFCKPDIPRGMSAQQLKDKASTHKFSGSAYESVKAAFIDAKQNARDTDLICVCGSIFVVAEVL